MVENKGAPLDKLEMHINLLFISNACMFSAAAFDKFSN